MSGLTNIFFNKAKFKKARERKGLSLTEAADLLGLSKQQLWTYENESARGTPSPDTLARACILYEVEMADFTDEIAA